MSGIIINPYVYAAAGLDQLDNVYSMDFDGVDDYVDCGNPTALQFTGAFSISFWMKGSKTGDQWIVSKDNEGIHPGRSYLVIIDTNIIRFSVATGGTAALTHISGGTVINDGAWHNIVCINTGSELQLYVDGASDATPIAQTAAITNGTSNFVIGALSTGDNRWFDGMVDEVAAFNYALSAGDVSDIYNATDTAKTADLNEMSTPPVAWYRMGD